MGTPGPEGTGWPEWPEPSSMPETVNIVYDPVVIDNHPNGYQIMYPETGNQYDNNANVSWEIQMGNPQPGKVRTLLILLVEFEGNCSRVQRLPVLFIRKARYLTG